MVNAGALGQNRAKIVSFWGPAGALSALHGSLLRSLPGSRYTLSFGVRVGRPEELNVLRIHGVLQGLGLTENKAPAVAADTPQ